MKYHSELQTHGLSFPKRVEALNAVHSSNGGRWQGSNIIILPLYNIL